MSRRARTLAWALGLAGVIASVAAGAVVIAFGAPASFLVGYVVGVLFSLLGALVASRAPRNPVGWLMIATAFAMSLTHLPAGYGYEAQVIHHGAWPLGSAFIWLGAWAYVPVLGTLPTLITLRFPDGRVPPRWRIVDWFAIVGTALFALAIALQPWDVLVGFLAIPGTAVQQLSTHVHGGQGFLNVVQGAGLTFIVAGYVGSAASLVSRFRRARGDESAQLKWFAYAGTLVAAAFAFGAIAWNFLGFPLYLALTPFIFAAATLPPAIGFAILRYRLYDIDLIINRTLVYGGLTAILGAVYAAVVTLLNRLFISASGARSDAAYVVTAFVVVVAASPVKDWLQHQVDRRIPHRSPSAVLEEFRGEVEAVVTVIDVDRLARRLIDEAVTAFDARSAALYVDGDGDSPLHSYGRFKDDRVLEVQLRHDGRSLGRLVMGSRRGDIEYTEADRKVLQRSADSVGEALALADHLGHGPFGVTSPRR